MQVKQSDERKIRIYAEWKVKKWFLWIEILLLLILVLYLILDNHKMAVLWLLLLGIIFLINRKIGKILDRFVYEFLPEGIRRVTPRNSQMISYEEIVEGLLTKPMRVTTHAFQVPMKKGWLTMYYENDATRQRKLLVSYRYMLERIGERVKEGPKEQTEEMPRLPNMTKILISEMDQRFYYQKKRRNQIVGMFVYSLFFPLAMGNFAEEGTVLIAALGVFLQYTCLAALAKGIYFGKQVEEKIEKRLKKYTQVWVKLLNVSYLQIVIAGILMIMLNAYWIFR